MSNSKKTSPRKSAAASMHSSGQCLCSVQSNPHGCVYQPFLDGWKFTPDVGNGQHRGEIFTPRIIVDKMIADSGILPHEAVYNYVYDTSVESLHHVLDKRIIEPAVGTGNFTATILYHRMRYVLDASHKNGSFDDESLRHGTLRAVSTLYGFDIDPGNVEVTLRRLLGSKDTINSLETIEYWKNTLSTMMPHSSPSDIHKHVYLSLNDAQKHWGEILSHSGIISRAWNDVAKVSLPDEIYTVLLSLLRSNFKVFDDLTEESTLTVPGYSSIQWSWWDEYGEFLHYVPHHH